MIMMKMKKILFLLSFILLPFATFAQESVELVNEEEMAVVDVSNVDEESNVLDEINDNSDFSDQNISDEKMETDENYIVTNHIAVEKSTDETELLHDVWPDWWLQRISFGYCNEWIDNLSETLNYSIMQWSPFKICFTMSNATNQDVTVRVRITDMINWICDPNSTDIHQFISDDTLESFENIVIPAWNYIIKEYDILYPIGIDWDQGACTMFNVVSNHEDAMISAIVNRAYPMKFFVWTLDNIKNEISVDNVNLFQDSNQDLIMHFDVKNIGNLENLIEVKWTVSNMFWFNKEFTIDWWHLLPENLWNVEANLWSLPSYWWLYDINFELVSTPYFSYDTTKSNLDISLIEPKTFDFWTTYFKMPWLILVVVVIFILLLIVLFRKPKQKVVYVQQPQVPQQ